MTTKELKTMVNTMREHNSIIDTRCDIENIIYSLYIGLLTIGRKELAIQLWKLYCEIDNIDTEEIVKMEIFNSK